MFLGRSRCIGAAFGWLVVGVSWKVRAAYLVRGGLDEARHDCGVVQWRAVLEEADLVAAARKMREAP